MPKKFSLDWEKINKKIREENTKKDYSDNRVYSPKMNNDGTFEAIIRFLPSIDTDTPSVKYIKHRFPNKNKRWFIEHCPTTIGKQCPICDANSKLWATALESNKAIVRKRCRKIRYVANILIVKDPQTPENNGKVFLYDFGKKINDKILDKMFPKDIDMDKPVMIYDYYEGANFKLSIKMIKMDGDEKPMPNYDVSSFKEVSCIGTDDEIEKIRGKCFPLAEFIDPKIFKSYEELSIKFHEMIGGEEENQENQEKVQGTKQIPAAHIETISKEDEKVPNMNVIEEDEAGFLAKLQSED